MKIPNILENIIYILVIAGLLIINTIFVLNQQEKVIIKAIEKETTAINNSIKKIKTHKGTTEVDYSNVIEQDTTKKFRLFRKR